MTLREYRPGDEAAITALDGIVFRRGRTEADWLWRFRDSPHGPALVTLAWDGDRLAGHYAVTPMPLFVDGRECPGWLSADTMVHPDYRGQRLFGRLFRETVRQMPDGSVWYGFPNAFSHRGFIRDLARVDAGTVSTLRLRCSQFPRLVGGVTTLVQELDGFDDRFDALWMRVRRRHGVIACRDARTLNWRYRDKPGQCYRLLARFETDHPAIASNLAGYCVYKVHDNELQVADLLAVDSRAELDLMAAVVRQADRDGRAAVALWCGLPSLLHGELERYGFALDVPLFYFTVQALAGALDSVFDIRNWYLTMGDDDVF